jgi:CBS domain-containing protein/Flp pilus assembly pilin Flp
MRVKTISGGRARRGTAATEYALILTVISCSVLFGARLILTSITWPSAKLTEHLSAHAPPNDFAQDVPDASEIVLTDDDGPLSETSSASTARQIGLLVVLFGGVVASVVVLRALRRRGVPVEQAAQNTDGQTRTVARFAVKRREIFTMLSRNVGDLLTSHLSVGQIQTKAPVCVPMTTLRAHLLEMMQDSQFHHLLVCDSAGRLVGILSDRDFRAGSGGTAAEIMTAKPYTVDATADIRTAISILLSNRISALPVVEDGRPIGIMTVTDLVLMLQATLQLLDKLHTALSEDEPTAGESEQVDERELATV